MKKNRAINICKCKYTKGDLVITKHDVFSDVEYTKEGATNVGKETYTVTRTEYWKQGGGFLVYGNNSDKRNCTVWHHELDLKLV